MSEKKCYRVKHPGEFTCNMVFMIERTKGVSEFQPEYRPDIDEPRNMSRRRLGQEEGGPHSTGFEIDHKDFYAPKDLGIRSEVGDNGMRRTPDIVLSEGRTISPDGFAS